VQALLTFARETCQAVESGSLPPGEAAELLFTWMGEAQFLSPAFELGDPANKCFEATPEVMERTFTEDGTFDAANLDEPIRGRIALEAGTRRNRSQVTSGLAVRHWFGMTVAQTHADGPVHALSYVLLIHTPELSGPGEPAIYRSTTCEDVLVRQEDTWLVRERRIHRDDLPD
jgi:hypothetical protein